MSDPKRANDHALLYLFGAGASHPCLPLARDVSGRMLYWGQYLQQQAKESLDELNEKDLSEMSSELVVWEPRLSRTT